MKLFILTMISFLFIACSSESDQNHKTEPEPQNSTLFDVQLDSLEKAKGVEQSLDDAVKEREKAMREQGT